MFTNPNTIWLEILVIIAVITFFMVLIGRYIYKKKNNLPTGDCAYCHKGSKEMIKEYHRYYK